jgi:hypothetical protein
MDWVCKGRNVSALPENCLAAAYTPCHQDIHDLVDIWRLKEGAVWGNLCDPIEELESVRSYLTTIWSESYIKYQRNRIY